ncbi:phosphatase PAP2 family protein [Paeniroseomonas aquatica]|uniref:Phosphatase PAP2 family protein n=2 Tax=Paeniroseomonas aquatica TaxID=373043 RepID=A0ABT8A515_9PROT|nr:phosphatase PAP2 family protein [Paeniroseomonas aquatica]MDN3564628.1 phosphatase PAP2 family protein [Paeniroseomonas aquatica]
MMRSVARLPASLTSRLGRREVGLLVAFLVVAALLLGFGMLAEEVLEGDTSAFDSAVILALRAAGNPADPIGPPWFEEMGRDVTALGSFVFLGFVLAAVVGYLMLIQKRGAALLMAVAVLGGAMVSTLLKLGFDRPRPDIVHTARVFTASFPSGHATLSAVTFLTIGALLTRLTIDGRVKVYFMGLAVFLTVMVGLSRLYLGVHYPTDVLAGWCVGSAWAILCWSGALWLQRRGTVEPAGSSDASVAK